MRSVFLPSSVASYPTSEKVLPMPLKDREGRHVPPASRAGKEQQGIGDRCLVAGEL